MDQTSSAGGQPGHSLTGDEPVRALWLGRAPFEPVLERQLELRERLLRGEGAPSLLLVEHPATLTFGRRGSAEDVLWSDEQLARAGIARAHTPRGGQVTLHAPGQLVAYPVVYVGKRIRRHIERLAQGAVWLLEEYGVRDAAYDPDRPGVYRHGDKLASIGIHVSRGIPVQGMSVNLAVEPTLFGSLVSCGLRDTAVVSARDVTLDAQALPLDAHGRWDMRSSAERFAALWSRVAEVPVSFEDDL